MDGIECKIINTVKSSKRSLDETIIIQDDHESESCVGHYFDKRPRLEDSNGQGRKKNKKKKKKSTKKSKVIQEEKQNSKTKRNKKRKTTHTSVGTNTDALHFEIYAKRIGSISDPEIRISNDIIMISRGTNPTLSNDTRFRLETGGLNANNVSIAMTSRGTSPIPRFSNDSQYATEIHGGPKSCMKGTSTIAHKQKASDEILDVSNGLILNELHSIGQTKLTNALKSIVPKDYTDLKGKGNYFNSACSS